MTHTQQLELWLGCGHNGSSFESDAHRREVWFRFRDKLMRIWGKNGKRPMGWWLYEAAEWGLPPRHPGAHQQSILYEFSNALGVEERGQLEVEWRKEFDKTWREGFSYFHEDQIFFADIARELAWIAMDLPVVLHDRWMAERQLRGLAVCEEAVAETGSRHKRRAGTV